MRLEKANVPMLMQTEKQYRNHAIKFANWCKEQYGCRMLEECSAHIQDYADFLVAQGRTPSTIHIYLAGICRICGIPLVSRTTREQLDDYVFGTGLNFQEFLCILINWLLKHPAEVKRIIHTDIFWERRSYRGDFSHIHSYEPIYRDTFKRNIDEVLDSVYRGVIPQRIRNDDGAMAMLVPCGAENSN